jgi:hypothetical protein
MKEIIRRLRAPTAPFWKRARWAMLALFACCMGVGELSGTLLAYSEYIPEQFTEWAKYGRVIGLVGAFLSQLTVEDKDRVTGVDTVPRS